MNKKLIAVLTLVMFALTLLPFGAFAATKNTVIGAVTTITGTGDSKTVANVRIDEDVYGQYVTGDTIVFTLPSGVEWNGTTGAVPTDFVATVTPAASITFDIEKVSSRVVNVTFATVADTGTTDKVIDFDFGPLKVTSLGTGDLKINLAAPGTAITEGDYTVARFSTAGAAVSMLSTKTSGTSGNFGIIRVIENSAGALGTGDQIKFKLAGDFEWGTPVLSSTREIAFTNESVSTDKQTLIYEVSAESTSGPAIIDIQTNVVIGSDADYGDIEVSLSGELSGDLVIGTYADYGVKVTAATAKNLVAAKDDQTVADVTIKDAIAGSLIAGRTIKMALPSDVKFSSAPKLIFKGGTSPTGDLTATLSNEDKVASFVVPTDISGTMEYKLDDQKIDIAPRFTGEVTLTFSGTAGVTGEVVVANVVAPLAIEATSSEIQIGVQNQMVGEIHITEAKKEILKRSENLVLELDNNMTFAATPKVEVLEGNLVIESVKRAEDNTQVLINIKSESTTPSKLRIYDVKVTTDRSVPEGDIKVAVKGAAVVKNDSDWELLDETEWDVTAKDLGKFVIATVVTPAVDGVVQPVVMTVGSTVYTIAGTEYSMDVAPYIKDARTYFPVRYVAQALGITADNVIWDGAQRTVTIFRGNRIVQVTIGSTTMLVNGVPLTMDAAPEITAERTMLPIRFVAQGLGVNVTWDAATQTVTLN